jgi:hypothetical protein
MKETQSPLRFQTEQEARPALRIPKPIDVFQCQTTSGTVFTARDDADFQIEHLVASNVTGSASHVTIYLVPDGGTPATGNMIVYQHAVPARTVVTIFDQAHMMMLQPGMTIRALCQTNDSINLFGYGYDYQGVYS